MFCRRLYKGDAENMEKELPVIFEEFNEARKQGFIKAKKIKDQGKHVVGIYCTYTPVEIITAAGAVAVGLCGTTDEAIKEAEKDLPRNLCPLIKSSYGLGVTDKCPYFYFSDLLVGETTCDGKKKMYELLGEIKPVHIMQLPQTMEGEDAFRLWKNEIIRLKERLEKDFHVEITEEKLREAIKIRNNERRLLKEFHELGMLCPPPMKGYDMQKVLEGSEFKLDRKKFIEDMKNIIYEIKKEYKNGLRSVSEDAPRILITGCPIGGVSEKVIKTIEDCGGVVVCYENCGGAKAKHTFVDETIDPIDAIAEKYLNIPCSVMTPNDGRIKLLSKLLDDYKVDAVIEVVLQACHTYNVEAVQIKRFVNKDKKVPYMSLETDYSKNDIGQIKTRIEAFIEMLI